MQRVVPTIKRARLQYDRACLNVHAFNTQIERHEFKIFRWGAAACATNGAFLLTFEMISPGLSTVLLASGMLSFLRMMTLDFNPVLSFDKHRRFQFRPLENPTWEIVETHSDVASLTDEEIYECFVKTIRQQGATSLPVNLVKHDE